MVWVSSVWDATLRTSNVDRANVTRGHGYVLLELCFMFGDPLFAEISLVRQDICPFASLILYYDRALVGCRQHATWSTRWPRTIIGTSRRSPASFLWFNLRCGNIGRGRSKLTHLSMLLIHAGGEYRKCSFGWNGRAGCLPDMQGVLEESLRPSFWRIRCLPQGTRAYRYGQPHGVR